MTELVPLEFEALPPQGPATVVVPCRAVGGVKIYYPRSLLYQRDDGTMPWWFPLLRAWWWVQRLFRP